MQNSKKIEIISELIEKITELDGYYVDPANTPKIFDLTYDGYLADEYESAVLLDAAEKFVNLTDHVIVKILLDRWEQDIEDKRGIFVNDDEAAVTSFLLRFIAFMDDAVVFHDQAPAD